METCALHPRLMSSPLLPTRSYGIESLLSSPMTPLAEAPTTLQPAASATPLPIVSKGDLVRFQRAASEVYPRTASQLIHANSSIRGSPANPLAISLAPSHPPPSAHHHLRPIPSLTTLHTAALGKDIAVAGHPNIHELSEFPGTREEQVFTVRRHSHIYTSHENLTNHNGQSITPNSQSEDDVDVERETTSPALQLDGAKSTRVISQTSSDEVRYM